MRKTRVVATSGLLLAGLTGLLAMRLPGKWLRVGAVMMWVPLLASTLDCIEAAILCIPYPVPDEKVTICGE